MRVGFIGLGSMGGDQARCLAAGDFELTVFDVYAPALQSFEGKARLAKDVAEVGKGADVVGVCVRDDQQVRETLEGDGGLLANMASGSVILIHSTVSPEVVNEMAAKAKARGIALLDACVSRTRTLGTEGPFIAVMVGGDKQVFERVRPVIDAYATDVFYGGDQGAGIAMKIINNMVTWNAMSVAAQAFRLAGAVGVDEQTLFDLMTSNGVISGPSKSFVSKYASKAKPDRAFMESQLGNGIKDTTLAEKLAEKAGLPIPAPAQTRDYLPSIMLNDF